MTSRWQSLSPRTRRLVLVGAGLEGLLKVAALVDLARRPAAQVRGSRRRWAVALVLVNSGGLLPVLWFRRGRADRLRPAATARGR